jgi:hypothetical protein
LHEVVHKDYAKATNLAKNVLKLLNIVINKNHHVIKKIMKMINNKIKIILGIIILSGLIFSCKKIIFREIKCREFQITGENYWFPLNTGDSVVFVKSSNGERKKTFDY